MSFDQAQSGPAAEWGKRNGMKTVTVMVLVLEAASNSRAAAKLENDIPRVAAYVRHGPSEPPIQMLARAEALVSRLFAATGVHIIWHAGVPAAMPRETLISIEIIPNTPEAVHRGALAYSQVFEDAHVTIFWDRLKGTPDAALRIGLLGHVLAHEITHVLEGINHHSKEGIMKAHWTRKDIEQMISEPLAFDVEDVRLIRLGLAARNSAARRVLPSTYTSH